MKGRIEDNPFEIRRAGRCPVCFAAVFCLLIIGCAAPNQNTKLDPKTCLETIPSHVEGLQILQGPRTQPSLIRDMVPAVCNGRALYRRMQTKRNPVNPGRVVFKVRVEWTGEVYDAAVAETTISSRNFLREVSDFIIDSDFVVWSRHDTDTIFLYPVTFGD